VWRFIRQNVPPDKMGPEVMSWSEIYRLIAPYPMLLKALLVPAASQEDYYRGILATALGLGLKEPSLLLGLLWHAPHGDSRHRRERWEYLQELATRALEKSTGAALVPELPAALTPAGDPGAGQTQSLANRLALTPWGRATADEPDPFSLWEDREAPGTRFDQTVSGQFFQLLAGLGEKVIAESCRYEALLSVFGSKAGDLENLVAEWQQSFSSPVGVAPLQGPEKKGEPAPIEFDWSSLINLQSQEKLHWREVEKAARDFLDKNRDLAADVEKVRLVIFFLKNYISINPEWAGLPFRQKLERAGTMARAFLNGQAGP
jgi:hypothetical protein